MTHVAQHEADCHEKRVPVKVMVPDPCTAETTSARRSCSDRGEFDRDSRVLCEGRVVFSPRAEAAEPVQGRAAAPSTTSRVGITARALVGHFQLIASIYPHDAHDHAGANPTMHQNLRTAHERERHPYRYRSSTPSVAPSSPIPAPAACRGDRPSGTGAPAGRPVSFTCICCRCACVGR